MLEHLLGIDQQVLWLNVSMDHIFAMAVLDSLQQLVNVVAYLIKLDSIRVFFEDFKQVFLKVLEDQVEAVAPIVAQTLKFVPLEHAHR